MTIANDRSREVANMARTGEEHIVTSPEKLAIFGGSKAVSLKYRERWRTVRLNDIMRIARRAWRQETTSFNRSGPFGLLEDKFCRLTESKYALAMNTGTATLHSAYFAVGVKPGDEVIIPSYTFVASASPILQLGGIPVFCEIDERTLTADPEDVERRITPRTRAICVVHIWGNPVRIDRFVEIAKRHNLALIEDCSHAHGAMYKGKPVGSWGDIGCFSLQSSKAVSAGEGGVAVTSNPVLYDHMLVLGHYGRSSTDQAAGTFDVDNLSLGLKFRPHLYGVELALGGISRLAELNERRRTNYALLGEALQGCRAVETIDSYPEAVRGGFLEFILRFNPEHAGGWNRGAFVKASREEGVPIASDRYSTQGNMHTLLHETSLFRDLDYSQLGGYIGAGRRPSEQSVDGGGLSLSSRVSQRLLTMPAFTKVSASYIRQCAEALRKVAACAAGGKDVRQL